MTTALFMYRCAQIGIAIRDLDLFTVGMVTDILIEAANDGCEYCTVAGQEDFDRF